MERKRRVTAGRRMQDLVGKAAQDDETFWSHDVWADENDSGNDSFHESDEDSDQRVDTFDSDFNDSETDNEADEMAAGEAEEAELQRQERSSNQKKGYVDIAKAGRELLQRKKGTSRKRRKDLMGDGINAGLVLNLPPSVGANPPLSSQPAVVGTAAPLPRASIRQTAVRPAPQNRQTKTLASTRSLRSTQRQLRAGTRSKTNSGAETRTRQATSHHVQQTKKPQRRFKQEELLLEAATVTEPENERWLLGRKRIQDLENLLSAKNTAGQKDARGGKVVCKFHSRRGCLNTLTFPEMDSVPTILTRKHTATTKPTKPPPKKVCVITGKRARYRDPKTNLGYHDLAAFKELRRRLQAREPLDQRSSRDKGLKIEEATTLEEKRADKRVNTLSEPETAKKRPRTQEPAAMATSKTERSVVLSSEPKTASAQPTNGIVNGKSGTKPGDKATEKSSGAPVANAMSTATLFPCAASTAAAIAASLLDSKSGSLTANSQKVKPRKKAATTKARAPQKTKREAKPPQTGATKPNGASVGNAEPSRPKQPQTAAALVDSSSSSQGKNATRGSKKRPNAALGKTPSSAATVTKPTKAKASLAKSKVKQKQAKDGNSKPRSVASPTTSSMIHDALAAYAKLHQGRDD